MLEATRQVLILVGGLGTRLGHLTRNVPKPLIDLGDGTTLLEILIRQLVRQGFNDIVLLAGHFGHIIYQRYNDIMLGLARIRVIVEPLPHGTAGALWHAREIVAPRFVLLNGDSFFDIDISSLLEESQLSAAEAFLALRYETNAYRYGSVELDANRIKRFVEKDPSITGPAIVSSGIYVMNAPIIRRIHSFPCSLEIDIFPILARNGKLFGRVLDGYFLDIGTPETLAEAKRQLLDLRQRVSAA